MLRAGVRVHGTVKDAVQRVVVRSRDGIKLVIVTTCATDGQAEKRLTEVVERVLNGDVLQIVRTHADTP